MRLVLGLIKKKIKIPPPIFIMALQEPGGEAFKGERFYGKGLYLLFADIGMVSEVTRVLSKQHWDFIVLVLLPGTSTERGPV